MFEYDEFEATQRLFEDAEGYSHELYRAGSGRNRLRHEAGDSSEAECVDDFTMFPM